MSNHNETIKPVIIAEADVEMGVFQPIGGVGMRSVYFVECFDKDGNLKWTEEVPNLVVDAGADKVLEDTFKASGYTAAWYVGIKASGTIASADVSSSHAGWAEHASAIYSDTNRPTLTLGAVASKSVDNSASKASFTIVSAASVAGAFIIDSNTKGGATGVLYGAADFGAIRTVASGDTLNVTVTLTAASA